MPLNLPTTLQTAAERAHGLGKPWVWLWDIELHRRTKTVPPLVFRMTSHYADVSWPPTSPGGDTGDTFYPFAFGHSEIEQNNDGDLPSIELTVDNTARTLMRYLHAVEGFEGNRATLWLTHADALTTYPAQEIRFDFRIAAAIASNETVSLRCETTNWNDKRIPTARYIQSNCRWKFGGVECAYPITPTAAHTDCAKTLAACVERGEDEAARGLPIIHPARFGGFPGIATQRSAQ